MKPVPFPEQNCTFHADGCEDLPAMYSPATGEVATCWHLSDAELLDLENNRVLWIIQHIGPADPATLRPLSGKGVQPFTVLTESPFPEPS